MKYALTLGLLLAAAPLAGQSLNLQRGQHGIEATAGWSTSDTNGGFEGYVAAGIGGIVDIGVGMLRFDETYDSGAGYDEIAPFARLFVLKQGDRGSPISVALLAQFYLDEYDDGSEADYIQVGPTFYHSMKVSDALSITPFVGFAFMTENFEQAGGTERTNFVQRDLGLQLSTRADRPWGLSATLIDQAYNTSTYRSIRLSLLRRL